jgi:hypothetical protein
LGKLKSTPDGIKYTKIDISPILIAALILDNVSNILPFTFTSFIQAFPRVD